MTYHQRKSGGMCIGERGLAGSDPLALSAGVSSVQADFQTSLAMIEDVIRHWPSDKKKQKAIYKIAKNISLL